MSAPSSSGRSWSRPRAGSEETLRSIPIDAAVLMGGCDKTTPGLIMGAISAGLPAIYITAGPMLRGNWHGRVLGSGSDAFKFWDERRAGAITDKDWRDIEVGIARSPGHCMTMGTASTMTAITEALGLTLPSASSIPTPTSTTTGCARPRAGGSSRWSGRT